MRRFGRLDAVGFAAGVPVQFFESHFVLGRRDPLLRQAASDGNQEEGGPHGNALLGQQFGDLVQLVKIPPRHGSVHLDGQLQAAGIGQHLQSPLEAAGPAAKGVMHGGVRAVEADAQPADTRLLGCGKGLVGRQRRGRGRQSDLQTSPGRVPNQVEQIAAFQRVATGQHQRGPLGKGGYLVDQGLGLLALQLVRVRVRLGRRAAMLANQIASLRDLVVEHQRADVKVGLGVSSVCHRSNRSSRQKLGSGTLTLRSVTSRSSRHRR
jgi:hypothetical protein